MTDDLKTIDLSKSHPYYRAYSPRRLRLNNGCITSTWVFFGLWLALILFLPPEHEVDRVGGAFVVVVFLSVVQLVLRGIRAYANAKWRRRHADETAQAQTRALLRRTDVVTDNRAIDTSGSAMTSRQTILFLAANPVDSTALRLSEEAREIREELERAGLRDTFVFHERGAVRPKDLGRTLIDLSPRYLHFSGHGGPSGAIYLEDEAGKSKPVPASALRALFKASGDHIHCVLLNACYSRVQAHEILTCVPFVIGMKDTIGDKAAIAFARGFYRGIGAGRPVPNAFDLGIAEMEIESIPEGSTPELLQR
jgi:CHAT domain-containing protein